MPPRDVQQCRQSRDIDQQMTQKPRTADRIDVLRQAPRTGVVDNHDAQNDQRQPQRHRQAEQPVRHDHHRGQTKMRRTTQQDQPVQIVGRDVCLAAQ